MEYPTITPECTANLNHMLVSHKPSHHIRMLLLLFISVSVAFPFGNNTIHRPLEKTLVDIPHDILAQHLSPQSIARLSTTSKQARNTYMDHTRIMNRTTTHCGTLDFTLPFVASFVQHSSMSSACLSAISDGMHVISPYLRRLMLYLNNDTLIALTKFVLKNHTVHEIVISLRGASDAEIARIVVLLMKMNFAKLDIHDFKGPVHIWNTLLAAHPTMKKITIRTIFDYRNDHYYKTQLAMATLNISKNNRIIAFSCLGCQLNDVDWTINPNLSHLEFSGCTHIFNEGTGNLESLKVKLNCKGSFEFQQTPIKITSKLKKLSIYRIPESQAHMQHIFAAKDTIKDMEIVMGAPYGIELNFLYEFLKDNKVIETFRIGSCSDQCVSLLASADIKTVEFIGLASISTFFSQTKTIEHVIISDTDDTRMYGTYIQSEMYRKQFNTIILPNTLKSMTFKFPKIQTLLFSSLLEVILAGRPDMIINGFPIVDAIEQLRRANDKGHRELINQVQDDLRNFII